VLSIVIELRGGADAEAVACKIASPLSGMIDIDSARRQDIVLSLSIIILSLSKFIVIFFQLIDGIELLLFVQGHSAYSTCIGGSGTCPRLKSWSIIVSIWRDSFL